MGPSCHHVFCTFHMSSTCTAPQYSHILIGFFSVSQGNVGCYVHVQKICYYVSVRWIMLPQPFILHSHEKTILVVKIIIIFQNSTHHYLQTTSKDVKSVMVSYFLFITSHFSTLHYSIQRYFLFSLLTFH